MPETIFLTPFLQVPKPDDGSELRYNERAVQDVLDFIALLPFGQNEWAGKPFELLPWELDFIRGFYGVQVKDDDGKWVRYRRFGYEEIPKKNGKSELAAALGLYHLLWDGEALPNVGIFAADKTNADIIYKAAKYMVEHSCLGEGREPIAWARDSRREIHTKYGGMMKVYSSEAKSKHGFSFSAILFDELHAQSNRMLWDVLTAGSNAGRRQQVVLVLTTAGDDPDRGSIGWEIHEKCRRILAWRRGEPESETDGDDPAWYPVMYGISALTGDDPDRIASLDIYDEELWFRCNPGLGHNLRLRDFRADARAAKQSEADERLFRWLRLNQWIAVKTVGWIPLTVYDKTQWPYELPPGQKGVKQAQRLELREQLRGKKCYGGLDLSKTTDLTAFVLLFPPQEGLEKWVALFWGLWRPEEGVEDAEKRDHVSYRDWARAGFLTLCPGETVDYSMVEEAIYQAAEWYDLRLMGYDPALSWTLVPRLSAGQPEKARGPIKLAQCPQDMKNMSPPMKAMEKEIRDHEMLHEHNTCARWNFGNVRCRVDGNENMKPMKNMSKGRIDVAVAWINARMAAMMGEPMGPGINEHVQSEDWGI